MAPTQKNKINSIWVKNIVDLTKFIDASIQIYTTQFVWNYFANYVKWHFHKQIRAGEMPLKAFCLLNIDRLLGLMSFFCFLFRSIRKILKPFSIKLWPRIPFIKPERTEYIKLLWDNESHNVNIQIKSHPWDRKVFLLNDTKLKLYQNSEQIKLKFSVVKYFCSRLNFTSFLLQLNVPNVPTINIKCTFNINSYTHQI